MPDGLTTTPVTPLKRAFVPIPSAYDAPAPASVVVKPEAMMMRRILLLVKSATYRPPAPSAARLYGAEKSAAEPAPSA